MSEERRQLEAAVSALERVTEQIRAAGGDAEQAGALADQAVALSAEISERLPRVIREIEDAAQGRSPAA